MGAQALQHAISRGLLILDGFDFLTSDGLYWKPAKRNYSTTPRNGNRVNGNHLDQSLLSSQKNRNSLTWVLVALTVCFTYPILYRVSAESRAGE